MTELHQHPSKPKCVTHRLEHNDLLHYPDISSIVLTERIKGFAEKYSVLEEEVTVKD